MKSAEPQRRRRSRSFRSSTVTNGGVSKRKRRRAGLGGAFRGVGGESRRKTL